MLWAGTPKPKYQLTVNGRKHSIETEAERPLLEVLREDLALTGTKYGCGEGQCRACTVLLDSSPVTSCLTPVSAAAGKSILTIEGLAKNNRLHDVQEAFIAEAAMQCGYCIPGMVLRTVHLLEKNPAPTDAEIVQELDGSLCRCCGYERIVNAVKRAAGNLKEKSHAA